MCIAKIIPQQCTVSEICESRDKKYGLFFNKIRMNSGRYSKKDRNNNYSLFWNI